MATLGYEPAASARVVREFSEVAVLPEAGDNAAICRVVVPAGTILRVSPTEEYALNHTILEGHRFAVRHIAVGEPLLSWGLTFGEATKPLAPGQYLANQRVLSALRARGLTDLPAEPNFDDLIVPHTLDEESFAPAPQLPLLIDEAATTFPGFARGERGIGTRNYIIVVGVSSLAVRPFHQPGIGGPLTCALSAGGLCQGAGGARAGARAPRRRSSRARGGLCRGDRGGDRGRRARVPRERLPQR